MIGFPLLSASLACMLVAAISERTWLGRFSVPGARQVAAVSFSLYLTHKQVYFWVHEHLGAQLDGSALLGFAVYNGAALAVATLLYLAAERPALGLRDLVLARADRAHIPRPAPLG